MGTRAEYVDGAQEAGFFLERDEDLTEQVLEFWVQSTAWSTAETNEAGSTGGTAPISGERLRESAMMHGTFFRLWRDHAVETRQMLFRLPG